MIKDRTAKPAKETDRNTVGRGDQRHPADMARTYTHKQGIHLCGTRTSTGQVLASSSAFGSEMEHWSIDTTPKNFRLEEYGPSQEDFYGLSVVEPSPVGPIAVAVAHSSDADSIAIAMLKYFAQRILWMIPLFALATLAIGAWSIRASLRPVSAISQRAAKIDPKSTEVRLPLDNLPSELVPLVQAINSAFDRLQEGFAIQRKFTANAAHELRTPLTMLTAGLDDLPESTSVQKLRADVARMNRLVNQLLRVARLDAIPVSLDGKVDLGQVVTGVVEYLAPWAIARGRFIGLEDVIQPIFVRGNAEEIGDAVRNLVENAVLHTPSGTEVTVRVTAPGDVTVEDKGAGVPAVDRVNIFARFWRGKGATTPGAGLGLAIVSEVARQHGGSVDVGDAPGGGASFSLHLRPAVKA